MSFSHFRVGPLHHYPCQRAGCCLLFFFWVKNPFILLTKIVDATFSRFDKNPPHFYDSKAQVIIVRPVKRPITFNFPDYSCNSSLLLTAGQTHTAFSFHPPSLSLSLKWCDHCYGCTVSSPFLQSPELPKATPPPAESSPETTPNSPAL